MKNQYRYFAIAIVVAFLILPLAGVASDQSEPRSAPPTRENDAGIEVLRIPEEHPPDMAVEKGPHVAPLSEPSPIIPVPRDRPSEGPASSETGGSDLQNPSEVAAIDGAVALPDLVDDGDIYNYPNKTLVRWDEPLEIDCDVRNSGTVNSGYFYVDYYLSVDKTLASGDYFVGYVIISNVGPASYANADLVISSFPRYVPPGTYYIVYWYDSFSNVAESDETNNIAVDSTKLTVAYPNKPDLLDDGVHDGHPGYYFSMNKSSFNPTEPYEVHSDVANRGPVTSGFFYVDYYLSTDTTITSSDYLIGYEYISSIGAEYWADSDCYGALPACIPAGTYYLGCIIDPENYVSEFDETNNKAVDDSTYTIVHGLPDLQDYGPLYFYTDPVSLTRGQPLSLGNYIGNQGVGNVTSPFYVDFYASTDNLITSSDRFLVRDDVAPSICPVGYEYSSATLTSFPDIPPGIYYVGSIIDPTGAVAELNEANNIGIDDSQLTVMYAVPTISSISPASKLAGDPGFTLTVMGTGFYSGSKVRWNGVNRTTTYISQTQLSAAIPNTDIAAAGTASVTVFNPTPGGGTSAAKTFTINNPVPTITTISPASKNAGDPAFTLTVTGTNFNPSSKVRWNGADRTTTYVSVTSLTAAIPASDIASAGTATVTVFNPTPGGGTSNGVTFTKNPPSNPVPTLSSISPGSKVAGDPGFTLTVTGTNFVANSKVRWNGTDRTTTYTSATSLTAAIPASDIASAGTASVTVFNPTPGGGTSAAKTFTINNPVPTITTISPTTKGAGDPGFTLTVTGTNFNPGSKVRWNGADRTTTYTSATSLTAAIPASDIVSAGTASVTVFNPTPGGGTSAAKTFTISGPTITVLAPNGGETYYLGGPLSMSWSYSGNPGSAVNIEVLRESTILKVIPGIPIGSGGSGSFSVTIPASTSYVGYYRIRVTSASNPAYSDTSNGPFTIDSPKITVTMPNGGENFPLGAPLPMSWTYNGNPGPTVTIEVLRSGAVLKVLSGIPTGAGGSGSYSVPMIPYSTPQGSDYTLRVTSPLYASCTDTSNGTFTISGPTITVKAPNGGETYHVGAPLPMSWTYTGDPGPTVTIEVLRSGAVLKVLPGIPTGVGGSGSYSVPMIPSGTPLASDYQIRVKSTAIGSCTDTSNGYFTIAPI